MSEGKRSDGQRGRDSATPRLRDALKKNKISRACFGLWRDASTRPTTCRSISPAGRVERGRGVGGGRLPRRRRASRDIDPRSRAASLRAASPETRTRPPRRARASSPDASVRKTSFLSSRVAPASRHRARHARPRSRGSPPGGGTSRSRHEKSERTTWRNASSLTRRAQSSAGRAEGHRTFGST